MLATGSLLIWGFQALHLVEHVRMISNNVVSNALNRPPLDRPLFQLKEQREMWHTQRSSVSSGAALTASATFPDKPQNARSRSWPSQQNHRSQTFRAKVVLRPREPGPDSHLHGPCFVGVRAALESGLVVDGFWCFRASCCGYQSGICAPWLLYSTNGKPALNHQTTNPNHQLEGS